MSAFRLFLCLTGLAVYLVVKQFILAQPPGREGLPGSTTLPGNSRGSGASSSSQAPSTRNDAPDHPGCEPSPGKATKPQTVPHSEVLKSGKSLVSTKVSEGAI